MNSIRIALSELRRLTTTRLGKIAMIALVLVPTLYAGLYLYANHDPYGALSRVPAAIVNSDDGTTLADGTALDAGDQITQQLIDSGSFDWHEVSAERAREGVRDGDYDFALIIPSTFSDAFGATSNFDPTQARLSMVTNDANSYLATTIADKVSEQVRQSITQAVGEQAATTFLTGLADVRTNLLTAADGADTLVDGLATAQEGSSTLFKGARTLDDGATELSQGLATMKEQVSDLPAKTRQLAKGARKVANGDAKIAAIGRRAGTAAADIRQAYAEGRSDLSSRLDELGVSRQVKREVMATYNQLGTPVRQGNAKVQSAVRDLNRLAKGADQVADGNEALADAVPSLVAGITKAASGSADLADGTGKVRDGARKLNTGVDKLHKGAGKLADGLRDGAAQIPDSTSKTREKLASTIGNPVTISSASDATAGSYGAGLAPFFLALAAWIGGYVIFTQIIPLSRRAMAANQSPLRVALGGWLAPAALGAAQMVVALTVVSIGVKIVPANLPATMLFMVVCSAVFIAIVHALCAWFGLAGLFLGLVMMVLQLVTAGGTFPWQTIPEPLHPVHHVMPMSYAVDGLRQLMYGGPDPRVGLDLAVLGVWFLVAVLASTRAARRQRVWSPNDIAESLTS